MNPKVIDCPDPGKGKQFLDAVCRNGIQLLAKARVTVRTKLERLVGGATEETIIARVGEGIVKAIGGAEHHTDVLANPNLISQAVLNNSLDAQTAFEIVSIDVAEIDVGANVGAELQANQAAADLRVAQAHAEKRRAAAVALEQEMKAGVEERQAKVMLAECERIGPDGEGFDDLFAQLRAAVLTHAVHEEQYEFRYLKQKTAGEAHAAAMATMVKAAEAIAPTHPHPSVNSATANNLVGPVVSVFDRTRDLVRKALAG